jgi:hypothetical protein
LSRSLHRPCETFTRYATHTPAEEREIESRELDVVPTDRGGPTYNRFVGSGSLALDAQRILIARETERVARGQIVALGSERSSIDDMFVGVTGGARYGRAFLLFLLGFREPSNYLSG